MSEIDDGSNHDFCKVCWMCKTCGDCKCEMFPPRDMTKPAEQQGMFHKFLVHRVDGSDRPGERHHGCRYFVLDLNHDPFAKAAMLAYAKECEETHPLLAADILKEFG